MDNAFQQVDHEREYVVLLDEREVPLNQELYTEHRRLQERLTRAYT